MELYKIIATVNNTSTTFQLAYLPENFEGVKISQAFSFVNPIGYNPKFSVDTMRIIKDDKVAIDAVFDAYGLESDVEIEIQKLKTNGYQYEYNSTFAIDFESYEKFDVYSEFALKSISSIDSYNNKKNTEININLTGEIKIPNSQKYINYVSLKQKGKVYIGYAVLTFDKNNESKIYNNDLALVNPIFPDETGDEYIYVFGETEVANIYVSVSGTAIVYGYTGNLTLKLQLVYSTGQLNLLDIFSGDVVSAGTEISFNINTVEVPVGMVDANDRFVITTNTSAVGFEITGDIFVDLKKITNVDVINTENQTIKFTNASTILNSIFSDYTCHPTASTRSRFTSSQSIMLNQDFITIKPSDFLSDFCMYVGLILNFKNSGVAEFQYIDTFFNNLLNVSNAVEITDFKDLSVKHSLDLNFSSVSVGQESKKYDIYTYLIDWNKKLTFLQENRNASENLDLTSKKIRSDFSGILDYLYKKSQQNISNDNDTFIFYYLLNLAGTTADNFLIYDTYNPRQILTNWKKFLSFAFQNFSKNTLTISSNGGTVDNLEISGVAQMDDFVLNETPRLLPIQYNFTCLLDSVDFSEKILKINDNGTDIYLFVINAETTDNLSEQKISGLKIQF